MTSEAARLRSRLGHPVIDADGHWLEFGPRVSEEIRRIGGETAARGFARAGEQVRASLGMTVAERHHRHRAQEAFWGAPTKNTRDRATALMPKLLYERLDEFGIDFSVIYPTAGLRVPRIDDDEERRAACRAFNVFTADAFRNYADRMTPAAVIPMHTPEEAIEELEFAKHELDYKVIMMGSMIQRPLPENGGQWFDMLGIDSAYDYDPVWAKCEELGFSPTFHRGSRGLALRVSPSNFVYNHIGHFAAASEAVCKAMFLGGVTRRFPKLKFAFLEGGAAWACILYADLIGHWEKRNREALEDVNPANLDTALLLELADKYGGSDMVAALQQGRGIGTNNGPGTTGHVEELDDYAACGIQKAEDFRTLFTEPFYFGCEADDRTNAWAFSRAHNPFDAQIKTLFGSDIGHFDVQNMADVLLEAYELVDDGLIDETDFRDFTFANPVRFWGEANPGFFDGTVVAASARETLNTPSTSEKTRA